VSTRLRQVVLITSDLPGVTAQVERELGLRDPYIDPGVGDFGLENRVYEVGDCFLEVLTPITDGTAGGRHLERHGGDSGYMAIFQVDDRAVPERRAAELGIRVVWHADLEDISGTHLHPADVGGAIVSLDWAEPPESWRWAGPRWTGGAPADRAEGGVAGITVAAVDPAKMAARWAEVLGAEVDANATTVELREAGQHITFVPASDAQHEGITACQLTRAVATTTIGGVTFTG
jgi:hypothetical protein